MFRMERCTTSRILRTFGLAACACECILQLFFFSRYEPTERETLDRQLSGSKDQRSHPI